MTLAGKGESCRAEFPWGPGREEIPSPLGGLPIPGEKGEEKKKPVNSNKSGRYLQDADPYLHLPAGRVTGKQGLQRGGPYSFFETWVQKLYEPRARKPTWKRRVTCSGRPLALPGKSGRGTSGTCLTKKTGGTDVKG